MTTLIRVGFSEAPALYDLEGSTLTVAGANALIARAAASSHLDAGCYDKTDLTVVVDGVDVYGIRFDISRHTRGAGDHIAKHLASSLTYYSKVLAEGGARAKYVTPEHIGGVATALAAVRAA